MHGPMHHRLYTPPGGYLQNPPKPRFAEDDTRVAWKHARGLKRPRRDERPETMIGLGSQPSGPSAPKNLVFFVRIQVHVFSKTKGSIRNLDRLEICIAICIAMSGGAPFSNWALLLMFWLMSGCV